MFGHTHGTTLLSRTTPMIDAQPRPRLAHRLTGLVAATVLSSVWLAGTAHAQVGGVSLSTSLATPQPPGTTIVVSASGHGGSAPYTYRFWVQPWGGGWQLVRDWSSASSYSWTPGSAGGYNLSVEARDHLAPSVAQAATGFTIEGSGGGGNNDGTGGGSMTAVALNTALTSPQPAGTTIVLSASVSGGMSPYSYRFWMQPWGGAWALLQDWSGSANYAWNPAPGSYNVSVEARQSWSSAPEVQAAITYEIGSGGGNGGGGSGQAMSGVSLAASVPSPRAVGTAILLSAAGSGGSAPYAYRFWSQQWGGSWTLLQDWSGSATYWWQPSAGNYNLAVEARGNGSNAAEVQAGLGYSITSGGGGGGNGGGSAPTCGPFVVSAQSPQPAGAAIPMSISCSGDNLLYYFKLQHWGSEAFTILQDWGASNSYTWRPTVPGGYNLWAEVRRASSPTVEVKIGVGFEIR